MTEIKYSLFICELCNNKQSTELTLLTLQDYGHIDTIKACIWKKHICKNCSNDILKVIKRLQSTVDRNKK